MSGTAHVHPGATLTPGKMELLATWLPDQEWFDADPAAIERASFFRFVDPDGEVGLDCMIIASDGSYFHVPVTWRATPLESGTLIGTLEHSVLGTRYCYDGPSDHVYLAELTRVIHDGDSDADIVAEGSDEARARSIAVHGTGDKDSPRLRGRPVLIRKLEGTAPASAAVLVGTWEPDGQSRSDVLAMID